MLQRSDLVGVALELVIIPALLMVAVILMMTWADLSWGAAFVSGVVIAILAGAIIGFLRLEKREDTESEN